MGLEEEVKRGALELGADLVGICAVEEVEDRSPSLLPGASSCVVFSAVSRRRPFSAT